VSELATVRLSGVSHRYDTGVEALAAIDFAVASGSFVSVVGPSGCGKSTLLRIIAGLASPSAGHVELAASGARGESGFVFQDPTLMPWASVRENVALPLKLQGAPEQGVSEALTLVGLSEFADAYPRELSGGMRMRASIARAMVTAPRLLLMDEPFAALDEFTRSKLNDDLLALWIASRCTIVFVTHSIREAAFLSQRVVVMSPRPGRMVADLAVALPAQRNAALRSSHAFSDECARIAATLGETTP
jgi:NitT/TauT family transport system ATP-binding protein